jgi:hypothetical protein
MRGIKLPSKISLGSLLIFLYSRMFIEILYWNLFKMSTLNFMNSNGLEIDFLVIRNFHTLLWIWFKYYFIFKKEFGWGKDM